MEEAIEEAREEARDLVRVERGFVGRREEGVESGGAGVKEDEDSTRRVGKKAHDARSLGGSWRETGANLTASVRSDISCS